MKQLDRLLFEQGGDCFFCKRPLAKADASIEHLTAVANGGTNAEENTVACCKMLNALFSNKPLKEKIGIVLRQKGPFRCPADVSEPMPLLPVVTPAPKKTVIETPKKSIAVQPDGTSTQKRTVTQVQPKSPTAPLKPASPPAQLVPQSPQHTVTCPTCKRKVAWSIGQIDFVCQGCGSAFRY